jgi:hypothetical protein
MQVQTSKQAKQPRIAKNGDANGVARKIDLMVDEMVRGREGAGSRERDGMGQFYLAERERERGGPRTGNGQAAEMRTMGSQLSSPAANRRQNRLGVRGGLRTARARPETRLRYVWCGGGGVCVCVCV